MAWPQSCERAIELYQQSAGVGVWRFPFYIGRAMSEMQIKDGDVGPSVFVDGTFRFIFIFLFVKVLSISGFRDLFRDLQSVASAQAHVLCSACTTKPRQ